MKRLVLESLLLLLYVEFIMRFRSFSVLHQSLRSQKVTKREAIPPSAGELCHAIDLACVFYFKKVMCLQRSSATTILLRRHGVAAEMVIGAQMLPFRSHSWVEVDGVVANDKVYIPEIYVQLERC
jgi:hypothetical protein